METLVRDAEAVAAVGRLGDASALRRAEACRLDLPGHETARLLVGDVEFLAGVPAYARLHASRIQELEAALDGIWPRSSPQRPADVDDAAKRCGAIVSVLTDARSALAERLAAMPAGDARDRMLADVRQVILLDERLADAGIDGQDPSAVALGSAALALCALYEQHRILSPAQARATLVEVRTHLAALEPVASIIRELASLSGLPGATVSQLIMLARAIDEVPAGWCPALDPAVEVDITIAALARELHERQAEAQAEDLLDSLNGLAWRAEEPGKLEAAARILANPDDPRGSKALAYAAAVGCGSEEQTEASATLSAMAIARLAMRKGRPNDLLVEAAALAGLSGDADPHGTLGALQSISTWRNACARTETMRRFHGAVVKAGRETFEELNAHAGGAAAALAGLPEAYRREPVESVLSGFQETARSLEAHVGSLGIFSSEVLDAARRPAGYIRERTAAFNRIRDEELFLQLGARTPAEVADALAWSEFARSVLPEGIQPNGRHVGLVREQAWKVVGIAADIASSEAEAMSRVSEAAPSRLVMAARAALTEIRLRECRSEVDGCAGWGLVAWLEEEGIEPELWGSALASRPEPNPGSEGADTPVHVPVASPIPSAPAIADEGLMWRRLPIVPQATLAPLSLECGSI